MTGKGFDSLEDAAALVDDLVAQPRDGETIETGDGAEVAPGDVFTPPFVREHTDAATFDAFVAGSPLERASGSGDLDTYVAAHSEFDSWEEMAAAAKAAWLERELGLL